MDKIEWTDSLAVGDEMIDEQHKELIIKLNDLSKALEDHREGNLVMKTLDFLVKYTNFHFSEEEKKMQASGYPYYEEHHKLHQGFIAKLKELEQDFFEDSVTRELGESVNTFMWNWLVDHIKEVDKNFGRYLDGNK